MGSSVIAGNTDTTNRLLGYVDDSKLLGMTKFYSKLEDATVSEDDTNIDLDLNQEGLSKNVLLRIEKVLMRRLF